MSIEDRNSIREALKNKFNIDKSIYYEEKIYTMCKALSEKYFEDLDEIYDKFAYEKLGELFYVNQDEQYDNILQDIDKLIINWDSSVYIEYRKKRESEKERLTKSNKVEKGEFPCRNRDCRSRECFYFLSQDRSADEAMTVNVICTKCGTKYKINN